MFLPLPDILRFKGKNAIAFCDQWETALRGRCKREGNTLVLRQVVKVSVEGHTPDGVVPMFGFEEAARELGRNGQRDASRPRIPA